MVAAARRIVCFGRAQRHSNLNANGCLNANGPAAPLVSLNTSTSHVICQAETRNLNVNGFCNVNVHYGSSCARVVLCCRLFVQQCRLVCGLRGRQRLFYALAGARCKW
jgi:hypothetical protein